MLRIYLSSVAIWWILLWAGFVVCYKKMEANGWTKSSEGEKRATKSDGIVIMTATACLPVWRIAMFIAFFYCAMNKKEE